MGRSLSDDVHWVGDTLGAVLQDIAGPEVFAAVEDMRRTARHARAVHGDERRAARRRLDERAAALDLDRALAVARAFSLYFQLVNAAEDVHRVRELRRREMEHGPAGVAESLPAVLRGLVEDGHGREDVLASLAALRLNFVFTAHPTEARRRTTERLLARVRALLEHRDRAAWTPTERRSGAARLRELVEALWLHTEERSSPPSVLDEAKAGLWYVQHSLFDAVPRLQRRLHQAFTDAFGPVDPRALPQPVRLGSWMGSDRDGNPHVTDEVTASVLDLQRSMAFDRYERDLADLVDRLAAAVPRVRDPGDRLARALGRAGDELPDARDEAERRHPDEPLRRWLVFLRHRLARGRRREPGGYPGPEAFVTDLDLAHDVLHATGADTLADGGLLDLMWRVRAFGFHLAALDVREDARVHRRVVAELLGAPAERDPDRRIADLERLRLPGHPGSLSAESRRLLSLLSSIADLQERHGPRALPTYALSHCESAADVLELHRLVVLHGLDGRLDLVPLLESPASLRAAEAVLGRAFAHAPYRAHLERRDDVQEVLIGYSDSMKEAGIVASRSAIRGALHAVARVCARHGLKPRTFHGRGGSVSRGGGPTYRAIGALPAEGFSGDLEITEQGEVRSFHFGHPGLALRYLEQTVGAALRRHREARPADAEPATDPADGPDGRRIVRLMAGAGERAYRELVADPDTFHFFAEATPFPVLAALNIASRPTSRTEGSLDLADLRAIPWVFAWSQCRLVLTGWYGVGPALERAEADAGAGALRELYARSPFLRDLLDNVQMILAKADMGVARSYAGLCTENDRCPRFFERILRAYDDTCRRLLRLTGQRELLDDDPVLQRSITLRNPYVDPLSHLQVRALREDRQAPGTGWDHLARLTVRGIAAGVRNTG